MPVRVAINGFGRIGRCLARVIFSGQKEVELIAINSRGDLESAALLFKYDSIHGTFSGSVAARSDSLMINGQEVHITRLDDPRKLPWKEMGVDIVLESTGVFRDRASNEGHLAAGAKKVIIGAPGKKVDATFVMGVNEKTYDPEKHVIVSNASCTTNCLAPVVKVLHQNFGVEYGLMTTIHSYTMDQRLLDGSHQDPRRARAAALSMVPTRYRGRQGSGGGPAGTQRETGRPVGAGSHGQRFHGGFQCHGEEADDPRGGQRGLPPGCRG